MTKLLSINADAKTIKGLKKGFLTGVMYFAPGNESGVMNVCPFASAGCLSACLYNAGRVELFADNAENPIKNARIKRTRLFRQNRDAFFVQLEKEIQAIIRKAKRENLTPVFRLNGTSDIPFMDIKIRDNKSIVELYPDVQMYDYTKSFRVAMRFATGKLPANYHVTFSRSEINESEVLQVLKAGGTAAVVFGDGLPETWKGYKVVNGDESDLRFLDDKNVVCGLKLKGRKAKKDATNKFVVWSGDAD